MLPALSLTLIIPAAETAGGGRAAATARTARNQLA